MSRREIFAALEEFDRVHANRPTWYMARANNITANNYDVGSKHDGSKRDRYGFRGGAAGTMLGIVRPWSRSKASLSSLTKTPAGEKLTRLLCRALRKRFPHFVFSTIGVNKNFAGQMHCDSGNVGESIMLTVGSDGLKGGDLFVYDLDTQKPRRFATKNKWVQFNGNHPHMTYPYTGGTRYSLVFFQHTCTKNVEPDAKRRARDMGFRFSTLRAGDIFKHEPKKKRIQQAADALRSFAPKLYKKYMHESSPESKKAKAHFIRERYGGTSTRCPPEMPKCVHRPVGRPKKGKVWDFQKGGWKNA